MKLSPPALWLWGIAAMTCAAIVPLVLAQTTRPAAATRNADPPLRPLSAGSGATSGEIAREKRATDPHWSADGCRLCHPPGQEVKAVPHSQIDALCLRCHDGRRAKREAHPLGRTFAGNQVAKPEGWPLVDGKLGCVTCHDIVSACDPQRGRPRENPTFLRRTPSRTLIGFCAVCHLDLKEQEPFNPHIMVTEDKQVIRRSCEFCHHSLLDERDRRERHGDAALRADPIVLCLGCHHVHQDFFEPGHIGRAVSPEMKAAMVASERARYGTPLPSTRPGSEAPEPTRLPLDGGKRVVCSTCHNPHQEGVFPDESVLSYGAIQPGQELTKFRLRGLGKEFCLGCHNK